MYVGVILQQTVQPTTQTGIPHVCGGDPQFRGIQPT